MIILLIDVWGGYTVFKYINACEKAQEAGYTLTSFQRKLAAFCWIIAGICVFTPGPGTGAMIMLALVCKSNMPSC